jgi:hypothetical protein
VVQLQGGAAPVGQHTLALGYGGSFNGVDMKNSAWIQAEQQGVEQFPLRLQPIRGAILFGDVGFVQAPPDIDWDGIPAQSPFLFRKGINSVPNPVKPTGDVYVMATFEMRSTIPAGNGNDTGCGRFIARQTGGSAWFRALEVQAVRDIGAENNRTWGMEVGVHNRRRGEEPHTSVGIYLHSGYPGWFDGTPARRCNTGILIEGQSEAGDGGHGWDRFILCRKGTIGSHSDRFWVDRFGDTWTSQDLRAGRDLLGRDAVLQRDMFAVGVAWAADFVSSSSEELKENIVEVTDAEAAGYLAGLKPVKFNFKADPGRQHIGFIAEDVPPAFALTIGAKA